MAQRMRLNTLLDIMIMMCYQAVMFKTSKMTGFAKKRNENATMSFRVNNKQLLKNYNKMWEKLEELMKIDFESKPVYGDDDKYIKTKIEIYEYNMITNFNNKNNAKRKCTMHVFINNNGRFCY